MGLVPNKSLENDLKDLKKARKILSNVPYSMDIMVVNSIIDNFIIKTEQKLINYENWSADQEMQLAKETNYKLKLFYGETK